MQLNLTREHLETVGIVPGTRVEVSIGPERYYAVAARTFADARPGDIILYEDAYRRIAVAISRGSAGDMFNAAPGQELRINVDVG
jgi:S-adenosylmethionine hydrolase